MIISFHEQGIATNSSATQLSVSYSIIFLIFAFIIVGKFLTSIIEPGIIGQVSVRLAASCSNHATPTDRLLLIGIEGKLKVVQFLTI